MSNPCRLLGARGLPSVADPVDVPQILVINGVRSAFRTFHQAPQDWLHLLADAIYDVIDPEADSIELLYHPGVLPG